MEEDEVNIEQQIPTIRRRYSEEGINFVIPECCSEGWDSCIHVVKPIKPVKTNIGL